MAIFNLPGPSAFDSDNEAEEILKKHDSYILDLSRKKVPKNIVNPAILADEIEELSQKVRIKFWLALRKKRIKNPQAFKAYIRCIVYTEVIDMVRQHKPTISLPLDEHGELRQGSPLLMSNEGLQDPLYEVEQEETIAEYLKETIEAVLKLPSRQQYAMICSLKDQLDDMLLFVDALRTHKTDLEGVEWPEERTEMQRLRASLTIARKKLRHLKE